MSEKISCEMSGLDSDQMSSGPSEFPLPYSDSVMKMKQESEMHREGRESNTSLSEDILAIAPFVAVSIKEEEFTSVCREEENYPVRIKVEDNIVQIFLKEHVKNESISITEDDSITPLCIKEEGETCPVSNKEEEFTSLFFKEEGENYPVSINEDKIIQVCVKEEWEQFPVSIKEEGDTFSMLNQDTERRERPICLSVCSDIVALDCDQVAGTLKQIDAGSGKVIGVNAGDGIFILDVGSWRQMPGALIHATAGPAGVWGVARNNAIFQWNGANWVQRSGGLKQIDAGGRQYLSGANIQGNTFCMNNPSSIWSPWVPIETSMKYYSCGPLGCWGVNSTDDVHFRLGVTTSSCAGTGWQNVKGKLSMIEVGTDGSVYGVTSAGEAYHRNEISDRNPTGTSWTQLQYNCYKFRHVSYDLNLLWLVTTDGKIFRCEV